MKKINWPQLLLFIVITQATGFLSNKLSGDVKSVYMELTKPALAPPNMLFGIVWPILYAFMGIALYLIWNSTSELRETTIFWFGVQLFLNFIWTIIFFRFELFWAAALVIIILDIVVAYIIYLLNDISKLAKWLMVPYLLWLLFATYLNLGIAILN